jgi:hypothetical protein
MSAVEVAAADHTFKDVVKGPLGMPTGEMWIKYYRDRFHPTSVAKRQLPVCQDICNNPLDKVGLTKTQVRPIGTFVSPGV